VRRCRPAHALPIRFTAAAELPRCATVSLTKNKWYDGEVNFLAYYRKFFGAKPGQCQGIGILTSSDSTNSVAAPDYDDFVLLP